MGGCNLYNKYLLMDWDTFDQSNKGWREFSLSKHYKEAGEIIIYYINNKQGLDEYQRIILNHHAGQMLAYVNNYSNAIKYFQKSIYKSPMNDKQIKWNAYIYATIAFLVKNIDELVKYKRILEIPSSEDGYCPNLPFVKSFIINFDKTYKEAYEAAFGM